MSLQAPAGCLFPANPPTHCPKGRLPLIAQASDRRALMTAAVYAMPEAPRPIPDGGVVTSADGVKRQSFVKEVARVGRWVMPGGKATTIDVDRLARWVDQFGQMKAAGIAVPLMSDHTFEAANTRGDVESVYLGTSPSDGKPCLFAKFTAIGEDAISEAARNDVSIYAEDMTDGTGREWSDVLQHIALTPIPVVTGLSKPVAVAASRGGKKIRVPVARLSREEPTMNWKPIAAALSLNADTLTDETAEAAIVAAIGKMPKAEQVAALETQVATLSRANAEVQVDPDFLDESAKNVTARLSLAQSKGKINAENSKALAALLCGTPEARPVAMLSRKAAKAAGLGDEKLADKILDIIDALPAGGLQTGTRTASQDPVSLSRGGSKDEAASEAEVIKEQARRAGVAVK